MFSKDTLFLTDKGPVKAALLTGSEKLAGWHFTQRLIHSPAGGFQLSHSQVDLVTFKTPQSTLSLTGNSPVMVSCERTKNKFFDLVLLEQPGRGAAVGIVPCFTNALTGSIYRYLQRRNKADDVQGFDTGSPGRMSVCSELYRVLNRYADRDEARYELHMTACRFGLPVAELAAGWQGVDRYELPEFFDTVDTTVRLDELKSYFGYENNLPPHLTVKTLDEAAKARSYIVDLCLFGAPDGHLLTVSHLAASTVNREGVLTPVPTERIVFTSAVEAVDYIHTNFSGRYVDVSSTAKIENSIFKIVPASWVLTDMKMPVYSDDKKRRKVQKCPVSHILREKSPALLYRIFAKGQATFLPDNVIVPSDFLKWWQD